MAVVSGLAEPLAVVVVALVLPFELSSTFVEASLAGVAGIMVVRRPSTPTRATRPSHPKHVSCDSHISFRRSGQYVGAMTVNL